MITKYLKYLYPVLFLIPLYYFILSDGIGVGIQWSFFRYQITYYGADLYPLLKDFNYIIAGSLGGKSTIATALIIISTVVLVIGLLLVMLNHTKISGILTILSGILSLGSCMVQYGFLLIGPAGTCIPFGVFLILIYGLLLFRMQPASSDENLLKKYDYLFLFFGILLIYSIYFTSLYSNDTIPSQLLPYYILQDNTVYLDSATPYISNYYYAYRFVDVGNGHFASLFPIVTPILITPLYVIPIFVLNLPMTDVTLLAMGRLSASLISALAGMFVYLACRYLTTRKIALLSVIIFAFATSTWSTSSVLLYAHGMVELLLAVSLYLIFRNEKKSSVWNIICLGICSGLFIFNRPSDFVLIIPVVLYVLWYYRAQIKYYIVSGIISGTPFLIYNLLLFHNPLGGYSNVAPRMIFSVSTITNYIGLLIAPNKGLLIFSPVLILALFGFWSIRGKKEKPVYRVVQWSAIAIVLNILTYALFDDWIGGHVYGPRYLTGILPFLTIGICIFLNNFSKNPVDNMKNLKKFAISALILVSIVVQFIGVFYYPTVIDRNVLTEKNFDPWNIENSIIICTIMHGNMNANITAISFDEALNNNETLNRIAEFYQEPGKKLFEVSF